MSNLEQETPKAQSAAPLDGIRILDFTHVFAGPFCTRTLADLGADVVHVESTSRDPGDRHRASYAHRNKRSITLDLKNPVAHDVALQLAAASDIVVENFSSGVMRRLGLDYETLQERNPQLIFISLSGYGHTGPRSSWTSMNMNLQAYTGLMMTTGSEGDLPTSISNSWNDYIGGLHGVIAVLQALGDRARGGSGRHIDLSQFECSVATLGALLMSAAALKVPPKRLGSRSTSAAPQGVYPCSGTDEWIAISVQTDEQWLQLVRVLELPELARDTELADTVGRMRRHDTIDQRIAAWTAGRSKEEAEASLQAAGVPAERMRRVDDFVASPDTGAVYRPLLGNHGENILAATLPFSLSESAIQSPRAVSRIGEHTREVLSDWLGLGSDQLVALEAEKAFV